MDAIICMAGSATRLNLGENKVFINLNNMPIFTYSLSILKEFCDNIILSVRPEDVDKVKKYLSENVSIVFGGAERFISVYNAMQKIRSEKVLIHDGARPFISTETLTKIINESANYDLILPYINIKGTVYQKEPIALLDRTNIIIAQTPQMVTKKHFIYSYNKALEEHFKPTDDVSLILKYNSELKVLKILDDEHNFKITTKYDLEIARKLYD